MIKVKRIFISYGHDKYAALAEQLKDDLKKRGHEAWYDRERLIPGSDWERYIEEGLDWVREDSKNGFIILLMTPHSVRRPDGFCLREISKANYYNLKIIPIMVADCEQPLSIFHIQPLDMRDCFPLNKRKTQYKKKFKRLLEALEENKLDFDGVQTWLHRNLKPFSFDAEINLHFRGFTGREWVLKAIEEWLSGPKSSKVFWITGKPGTGKTAISAWLSLKMPEISAIHFCKHDHTQKSDPCRIILSIVYQLATQLHDYMEKLKALNLEEILSQLSNAETLFDNLILQPLLSNFPAPGRTITILIDALDETSKEGKNELAALIAMEFPKTPNWLKLIVTSRLPDDEPELKSYLDGFDHYEIDPALSKNREDIKTYLENELSPVPTNIEMTDVVETILNNSEGLFLYAKYVCDELKNPQGKLSFDRLDEFPRGLNGLYTHFFRRYFESKEYYKKEIRPVLRVIIAAREPLKTTMLSEIYGWNREELNDFIMSLRSLFPVREGLIQGFHRSLKDWLTDESKAFFYFVDIEEGHRKLSDFCFAYKDIENSETREYALKYIVDHLYEINDHQRLWLLLRDEDFRKEQITTFNQYDPAFYAARKGIELYIKRDGKTGDDDPRLCWLVLQAGNLGYESKIDFQIAFEWAERKQLDDPNRIEDTLQRLQILDEENFFKAAILLLWIEAGRQEEISIEQRSESGARRVLDTVEKRIPPGPGTVDWSKFLDSRFMAWWSEKVLMVFPSLDLTAFIGRTEKPEEFVASGCKRLKRQSDCSTVSSLGKLLLSCTPGISYYVDEAEAVANVAQALAASVDFPGKQELFEYAINATENLEDTARALYGIFKALAEPNDFIDYSRLLEQALSVAVKAKYNKGWALTEWVKAMVTCVDCKEHYELIEKAITASREITDPDYRARTLAAQARALMVAGRTIQAEKVFEEAFDSLHHCKDSAKISTIEEIAEILAAVKDFTIVRPWFDQLVVVASGIKRTIKIVDGKTDILPHGLTGIVRALVNKSESDERNGLFGLILEKTLGLDDSVTKVLVLCRIAEQLAGANKFMKSQWTVEQALSVLDKVYRTSPSDPGSDDTKSRYEIAVKIAVVGEIVKDVKLIKQAMALVFKMDHFLWCPRTLPVIGKSFAALSDSKSACQAFEIALSSATALKDDKRSQWDIFLKRNVIYSVKMDIIIGIVDALTKTVDFPGRNELIEKTLIAAGAIKDIGLRWVTLSKIAQALASAGMFKRAIAAATAIDAKWKYREEALRDIARELADVSECPDRHQLFDLILKATDEITSSEYRWDALSEIAVVIADTADFTGYHKMINRAFNAAGDISPSWWQRKALSRFVYALVETGEQVGAKNVFKKMFSLTRSDEADHDNEETVSQITLALAAEGFFKLALAFAGSIKSNFLRRKVITNIAQTLAALDEVPGRRDLFKTAQSVALSTKGQDYKIEMLCEIGKTASVAGETGTARQAFNHILKSAPNLDNEYEYAHALSLLSMSMISSENFPDRRKLLIKVLEETGNVGNAKFKVEVMLQVAQALVAVGDDSNAHAAFRQALAIITEIDQKPDVTVLCEIAKGLSKTGDNETSELAFQQALFVVDDISISKDQADVITGIASALLEVEEFPGCQNLFAKIHSIVNKIPQPHIKEKTLSGIVGSLAKSPNISDKYELFTAVLEAVEQFEHGLAANVTGYNSESARSGVLRSIAQALVDSGEFTGRSELFERSLAAAKKIEAGWKKYALGVVVEAIARADYLPLAKAKILELTDNNNYEMKKANSALAKALARIGLFEQAFSAAYLGEDSFDKYDANTLSEIALLMGKTDEFPERSTLFERLIEASGNIWYSFDKNTALLGIVKGIIAAGDFPGRAELFAMALEYAGVMYDSDTQSIAFALSNIINTVAEVGEFKGRGEFFARALELGSLIQDPNNRSWAISDIAKALPKTGDFPERLELLHKVLKAAVQIPDKLSKSGALNSTAEAYAQLGAFDLFLTYIRKTTLPDICWSKGLPSWRNALIKDAYQPEVLLRKTFDIWPFDLDVARNGVICLLHAHIKAHNIKAFEAIVRLCPELGIALPQDLE